MEKSLGQVKYTENGSSGHLVQKFVQVMEGVRAGGNGFVKFNIIVNESVLFAKWLTGIGVRFLHKHEGAVKHGGARSYDSCFQEFVHIVYCYLFQMMREAVLINGDYAVRVCHANLVRESHAVTEIQIMRAEHVRVFVKECRIAGSETRRYMR